jgi:hypothetical protein
MRFLTVMIVAAMLGYAAVTALRYAADMLTGSRDARVAAIDLQTR